MYTRIITNSDYFGHKADLNYSAKGSKHSTLYGLVLSWLIRAFMLIYTIFLIKKLVMREGNINRITPTHENPMDQSVDGAVNFNETDLFVFYKLLKQRDWYNSKGEL